MADRPLRFEPRMTPAESLMWAAERDPMLRSAFLSVTFLDGTPDVEQLRERFALAATTFVRLRQRVSEPPGGVGSPEWVDDENFDLDFHVRRLALPAPGSDRQLLDLAAVLAQDAFDPARPLWTMYVVEGLSEGRSAFLSKMHHTITDGVGGVRLSAMFIDLAPDATGAAAGPAETEGGDHDRETRSDSVLGSVGRTARGVARQALDTGKAMVGAAGVITRPGDAAETVRSLARQVLVTESARSPLWAGRHSLRRRFETLRVSLDEVKAAAKRLDGTVNDFYVTAVAGGAGAYHRAKGSSAPELRMSMPISTRGDRSAGGNAFLPVRVLVPAGIEDPVERFVETRARLRATKAERALSMGDSFAGALTSLPTPLLVRFARQQVETVDFATSNVRGAPFDLWISGARILANHPMGPTAGTAFNATTLSYKGSLDIGLNIDRGAVDDPGLLRDCIAGAFSDLLAAAGT